MLVLFTTGFRYMAWIFFNPAVIKANRNPIRFSGHANAERLTGSSTGWFNPNRRPAVKAGLFHGLAFPKVPGALIVVRGSCFLRLFGREIRNWTANHGGLHL